MKKTNYHTHSKWSDGKFNPEKTVLKAIELGYDILGFSDHSPVPFKSEWNMKYENLISYYQDIKLLKEKYSGQIEIYLGMEIDFIDNFSFVKDFNSHGLEYTIGGVHYHNEEFSNGDVFNVDASDEIFSKGLNELYSGDIKKLVKAYYELINKMVLNDKPDVIAHLDLVEKFNKDFKYFNSSEKWYIDVVKESLDLISKSGCILELNSRSRYKGLLDDFSPRVNLAELAKNFNISFTISGDAHIPDELDLFWNDSVEALKSVGYMEIMYFSLNEWKTQKFE